MGDSSPREHYIPLRKSDLVRLLCDDRDLDPASADRFRRFSELLSAVYHYDYHQLLEELKDEYAPFDPDAVTKPVVTLTPEQRDEQLGRLFGRFIHLMERANFVRLGNDAIEEAARQVSAWGVNMHVDFSAFDRLEIFARGDAPGTRFIRPWQRFWRREPVQVPVYQRLVLFVKLKPHKSLPETLDTDGVFLKAFKDIPKADLEMLLPGTRLRMPGLQRLKLGGSVVGGGAWVGYTLARQVSLAALSLSYPSLLIGPALALFGYGYKQYYGYQSTVNVFHLRLTQSLYYQTLGNNLGVLFHLLDEAEEQDCREALLAYHALWRHAGPHGWTVSDLDHFVEMELARLAGVPVDFEADDALAKLERLQLVTKADDRYAAVPIEQALEALDAAWDDFFKFNPARLT